MCTFSHFLFEFILILKHRIRMYSASAFAANTMVRSAVAAAFPLFTVQMFTKVNTMVRLAMLPY